MAAIQQPLYGAAVAVTPICAENLVMVKQGQTSGGASIDDGMAQSGAAVTAKNLWLSQLASYQTANLNHVTASNSTQYSVVNPLSLWSGFGQMTAEEFSELKVNNTSGTNGRFNTSENARGNWAVSPRAWTITLSATRTAFGCYATDLGDVREGEVELRFYNDASLVRIVSYPTISTDKPRPLEAMWMGYADGNSPFNRIEAGVRQYNANPAAWDYIGWDDFTVGECIACISSSQPQVFYGANTTGDAAKTVTGAALTARNAWLSAVSSNGVCDFESVALGATGPGSTTLAFTGSRSDVTALLNCQQWNSTHTSSAESGTDIIDNNAGSLRWNTTSGGSKWYEFTDELTITFSAPLSAIGFYVTDLGNHNATLRVTLRRANGSAVSYYLPKAAALPGADSLLRFWGVTNESGTKNFTSVVLQTVYYSDLTPDVYDNPVSHTISPAEMVGIDDLLIG